jgi:hypothetical protein
MSSGVCVTRFVYDGVDDLIVNYNNEMLFTHELLEDFVRQGEHGAITHHGFFKAKIEQWLQTLQMLPEPRQACRTRIVELLQGRHIMEHLTQVVFDYMTLSMIDYNAAFQCQCDKSSVDQDTILVVYDNACKTCEGMLRRHPGYAVQVTPRIDGMHFASHQSCSFMYNHLSDDHASTLNVNDCEQSNVKFNYMGLQLAHMGQARGLFKVQYTIARRNLDKTRQIRECLSRGRDIRRMLKQHSLVMDGVRLGLRAALTRFEVPWLRGYDHPEGLAVGSLFQDTILIPSPALRQTLMHLLQKKTLTPTKIKEWEDWITTRQYAWMSDLVRVSNTGSLIFSSATDADLLLPVLQHWSSGAPEIMLFPPAVMQTVHDIVLAGCITATQTKTLVSLSDGIRRILSFFQARVNDLGQRAPPAGSHRPGMMDGCVSNHLPVCDNLLSLFKVCLPIARKCLFGRTDFESRPFPELTSPWNRMTDFEKYIRSGVSQHIPVCRTMPRYAIDEVNAVSRAKRRSQRHQEDEKIVQELKDQSAMRGVTCNKMKIRKRLTTDGLFTMHCLGCGIVLHYAAINKAETALTADDMLVHHAHTLSEKNALQEYLSTGTWTDPVHSALSAIEKLGVWET